MFPIPFNFPFIKKNGERTTIGDAINAGGGGESYTLPTASASTKGGVKIGSGLKMTGEVLSVDELPAFTAEDAGRVLAINGQGQLEWAIISGSNSFAIASSDVSINVPSSDVGGV